MGIVWLCYNCTEYTLHVLNSILRDIVHMPLFQMQIQTEAGICLQHITILTRVYYKLDIQWTELANYSQGTHVGRA